MRRLPRDALTVAAVVYFLIDLVFLSVLRPLRRRLMTLRPMLRLRLWIEGLNRYVALLLLLIPWAILEPVKPLAVVIYVHHHRIWATWLIVGTELIKVTLFEQVFDMAKPQLLTFHWFAWGYGHWQNALAYCKALPVYQWAAAVVRRLKAGILHPLK